MPGVEPSSVPERGQDPVERARVARPDGELLHDLGRTVVGLDHHERHERVGRRPAAGAALGQEPPVPQPALHEREHLIGALAASRRVPGEEHRQRVRRPAVALGKLAQLLALGLERTDEPRVEGLRDSQEDPDLEGQLGRMRPQLGERVVRGSDARLPAPGRDEDLGEVERDPRSQHGLVGERQRGLEMLIASGSRPKSSTRPSSCRRTARDGAAASSSMARASHRVAASGAARAIASPAASRSAAATADDPAGRTAARWAATSSADAPRARNRSAAAVCAASRSATERVS